MVKQLIILITNNHEPSEKIPAIHKIMEINDCYELAGHVKLKIFSSSGYFQRL